MHACTALLISLFVSTLVYGQFNAYRLGEDGAPIRTDAREIRNIFLLNELKKLLPVRLADLLIRFLQKQNKLKECSDVCLTEDCTKAAARISEGLDYNVKPCDNFYDFACGNWRKEHVIPDDKPHYGVIDELVDDLTLVLKNTLTAPKEPGASASVNGAKDFYSGCVDTNQIEKRGLTPVFNYLERLGGWPILDSKWSEAAYKMESSLAKLVLDNTMPILRTVVHADAKDAAVNILSIDQATLLGMPSRDYFLQGRDNKILKAYETFAVKVAKQLGANPASVEKEVADMVDFEISIAKHMVKKEDRRNLDALYTRKTISKLSEQYPQFQWLSFFQEVMSAKGIEIPITASEPVVDWSTPYFDKLFPILSKTSVRTVANYMGWIGIKQRIESLPQVFRTYYQEYLKALRGTSAHIPRWRYCIRRAQKILPMAVGRLYVDSSFDSEAKTKALEMISDLMYSLKCTIQKTVWMDQSTKKVALEKADAMRKMIGFPDNVLDNSYLDILYKGFSASPTTHFENDVVGFRVKVVNELNKLRKPVDNKKWHMSPAAVNAYYSPNSNDIVFPAGILQPPFYNKNYPKSLNYGGIGVVIGHEISHGFDDVGRQYDKDGNLRPWWSNSSLAAFKDKAQCVIDQYSNYLVPEANMKINGIITQGENIADNGGVKEAFMAYRYWVQKQGQEERRLPGLKFNNNQLFFINYAQTWCENIRKKEAIRRIRVDPHSAYRFRVNGPLQNSKEFSEAFSCPASSYMNPAKKCVVW